ncbi:oligopeptide ABC transporter (ATP-binding protein) [[Clostridium] ultunense Esp]|uniref:Oligopeptide ABC transporter (ATP-binding protein) n=1 Tax=[Clostridium] ultunense Esp TaxID=1288971 RepID=M1ZI13_9FIRM|nr:ABC transporter ATP-binding protein [Schnuerera ultunensis]CCQ98581.1 oligopeptide ABC transporter (ATP-binding protein) [[Clostridium] ultunense Esp]SHD78554.1 oligopeptide ABC transporter (ATP-binding protein) [[Clostridium] ultunense Esp]
MDNIILSVRRLVTEFKTSEGKVIAVNDVSFDVEKGKVLGIVGESGCGKSVTSLSIMRLVPKPNGIISNGQIIFDNKDLLKLDDKDIRSIRGNEISMIFQEPMTALNPVFTVGFQISEALELHTGLKGENVRKKCIELLEIVKIPRAKKVIDEYPHQLSGGMRQRVMIAMAISCNPKLLIADEPTTALDVTIQAQILDLMKNLIDELDMSIIFITHDLGVISEMADMVVVMYAGKIVEEASVEKIFENPLHFYTKGLMNSRPSLLKKGDKLQCIQGMIPSPFNMPKGCAFEPRCNYSIDKCKVEMPDLLECEKGHKVRCWVAHQKVGDNHER